MRCVSLSKSIGISWWWYWLSLKPVITTKDDVACSCEESLEPLESLRDDIVRICPSELFESCKDLLGLVCAWYVSAEESSTIGASFIQHSLLECTSPVFC